MWINNQPFQEIKQDVCVYRTLEDFSAELETFQHTWQRVVTPLGSPRLRLWSGAKSPGTSHSALPAPLPVAARRPVASAFAS
ncbi:MAG: hypothetical protein VB140_02560 [Burkholderia sp.]